MAIQGLNICRQIKELDEPMLITEVRTRFNCKGWLARIEIAGPNARFDLERDWIRPDEADLSRAGNGTKTYNVNELVDGVYEAASVWRSFKQHRVFFEVEGGEIAHWTDNKREAKAWLAA